MSVPRFGQLCQQQQEAALELWLLLLHLSSSCTAHLAHVNTPWLLAGDSAATALVVPNLAAASSACFCCCCQVVRCVRELPYSVADVELLEDAELLEALQGAASNAVMQVRGAAALHCPAQMAASLAGCR
jgi:hypothetical protein